jgi:hypothetical protein
MRIGIDISQVVYEGTGVGRYIRELVPMLLRFAPEHEYILFGSSLRQRAKLRSFASDMKKISGHVTDNIQWLPARLLDFLWNILHIVPITWFTGPLDVFWSSDWTQPPLGGAVGITTIHDVSFFLYPDSFPAIIRTVQKRRLQQAKKECAIFLCDSEATKQDVATYMHIEKSKLFVVYPGYINHI